MYVAPTWNSFYEIKDSVLFEIKIKSFLRKTQIEELLEPSQDPLGKLKSLPDHGGNRTRDLWDTSP
jgi:hypothetical protein